MGDILISLLLMVICLIAEGFFSGSEIGVVSADRMKLRMDSAKGSRGAKLALAMLSKPEWLLSTTLVGTNIAVVTNTTVATALMIQLFGADYSWLAIVLVAPLIWVFGEIVPKSVFQQRADVITPRVISLLKFCSYLFYPILIVFSFLARWLSRALGDKPERKNPFTLREEIMTMMRMNVVEGDIKPLEKTMIRRLFNFEETTAGQIMTPLIDAVGVEQGAICGAAMRIAAEKAHKRLPVYAERVDKVIGVLDSLDLLGVDPSEPIDSFVKPVDYAPGSRSVQDLFLDMRRDGQAMSVIVDEFGGAEGIVTIEDIIEEVVEDMQDEYDIHETPTQWIRKLGEQDYVVSARVDLGALSEELGIDLPSGKYATLAGFLLAKARDVPPVGTEIKYRAISFDVQRATPQAIQEVRIRW